MYVFEILPVKAVIWDIMIFLLIDASRWSIFQCLVILFQILHKSSMRFMVRSSKPKSRDEPPASNNDDSDSVMYMMRRNIHDVIKGLFPASKNPIFRDAIILHLYIFRVTFWSCDPWFWAVSTMKYQWIKPDWLLLTVSAINCLGFMKFRIFETGVNSSHMSVTWRNQRISSHDSHDLLQRRPKFDDVTDKKYFCFEKFIFHTFLSKRRE